MATVVPGRTIMGSTTRSVVGDGLLDVFVGNGWVQAGTVADGR